MAVTPPQPWEPPWISFMPLHEQHWACVCLARTRHPSSVVFGNGGRCGGKTHEEPKFRTCQGTPLTVDGEIEVAAVKFVLGGHLTAVATSKGGLGICDAQLKQVHLWG